MASPKIDNHASNVLSTSFSDVCTSNNVDSVTFNPANCVGVTDLTSVHGSWKIAIVQSRVAGRVWALFGLQLALQTT